MRILSSLSSLSSLSLAIALSGCPAKVATVELAPESLTFSSESDSKTLTATARDANGSALAGKEVTWTSADPAVATVDTAGKVKPVGSGKTTVTAKVDEVTAAATVGVSLTKSMKLESPAIVLKMGAPSSPLKVTFGNEKGEPVERADARVAWTSADPNVATVDSNGVVTGVAPGSTSVTARFESLTENLAVTVNPADAAPGADETAVPAIGSAAPAPVK